MKKSVLLFLLAGSVLAGAAEKDEFEVMKDYTWSPVQISVFPFRFYRLVPPRYHIYGLNAGFVTENQKSVSGVSADFVCTAGDVVGVSAAAVGFYNTSTGFSAAGFNVINENNGVTAALYNIGSVRGGGKLNIQIGGMNFLSPADVSYFSWGTITDPECRNAPRSTVVQIGAFNSTECGFQIGALNYNHSAVVPWLPLFNYSPSERDPAP